jgi:uncharacterized protein YndB with AHSA1/START domain
VIDVSEHLSAVSRQVGSRVLEAGEARVVTISRTYVATVDEMWDACTNPERIPRWFLPVSGELRPGGRYQLEGNAGGVVERCAPPRSFAVTWEFGDQVSWVEVRLDPAPDGGTRFTLEHVAHVDDHWERFGPGAVGIGWEMGLLGLAGHVAGGAAPTPEEGAAWAASAEGREFIARSSDGWCAAHVAAGEDPAVARGMADRTTAAYTGVPEEAV